MALDPFKTRSDIDQRVTKATGGDFDTRLLTSELRNVPTWSPAELRGIPAVGFRCGSGAIAESEPGWDLDEWPEA
jgi:hypothetical protein